MSQTQAHQAAKMFMFAPGAPTARHTFTASTSTPLGPGGELSTLAEDGRALELLRRGGDGTLNVKPASDPDADYAAALQRVQFALGHLDESLPNGQLARTEAAMRVLIRGASELQAFLAARGLTL